MSDEKRKSKGMGTLPFALMIFIISVAGAAAGLFIFGNGAEIIKDAVEQNIYVGGVGYSKDITEIVISGSDIEDYSVLNKFEKLERVDLRGQNIDCEQYESISKVLEGKAIVWRVPIGEGRYDSDLTHLVINEGWTGEELLKIKKYLTSLKVLDTGSYPLCDELYDAVSFTLVSDSDCELICSTEVYGKKLDSSMTMLNLNKVWIKNTANLENAIRFFPNLKQIEMCECGQPNEVMAELRDKYPDKKFVWKIYFLDYAVRTDIQVFSTLVDELGVQGNEKTFRPLFRYCTDLKALDLGHYQIKDISEIVNLKKLQVLILADNYVRDLTPLVELQDLHYVELFFNGITDVTPLTKLENLEELNLCYNRHITNAIELTKCKKLKRLYMSHSNLSSALAQQIKAGLPEDCEFNYWCENAVNDGWRSTKKNKAIRTAFYRWRKVVDYQDWEHVTYK